MNINIQRSAPNTYGYLDALVKIICVRRIEFIWGDFFFFLWYYNVPNRMLDEHNFNLQHTLMVMHEAKVNLAWYYFYACFLMIVSLQIWWQWIWYHWSRQINKKHRDRLRSEIERNVSEHSNWNWKIGKGVRDLGSCENILLSGKKT